MHCGVLDFPYLPSLSIQFFGQSFGLPDGDGTTRYALTASSFAIGAFKNVLLTHFFLCALGGASSPHASMTSPFDFNNAQGMMGDFLVGTPDMSLAMGLMGGENMSLDVMAAGMSTGMPMADDSNLFFGTGSSSSSAGFGHQQQLPQHRSQAPSRSASHPTPQSMTPGSTPSAGRDTIAPQFNSALVDESFLRPHIMYYFGSVLPMQYLFQQKNATTVIKEVRQ